MAASTVLLVCGSVRAGSTTAAALATARAEAPAGVRAVPFDGLLDLAMPEYAGDMPGLLKEALAWTIGAAALDGKPIAWVNASANPSGAADTHRSLALILRWAGASLVEEACAHVPVPRAAVGPDGTVAEPGSRAAIAASLAALVAAA